MSPSRLTRGRLGITPALLEDLSDARVAAILGRYCNARTHDERVFGLVMAEMERRDRLFAEQAAARARVLAAMKQDKARQSARDRLREDYQLYVEAAYLAAERETRGHLLNRRGVDRGVHPRELFSGNRSRAYAYASEELRNWWEQHGRVTFTEYQRQSRETPAA